jgi:hypothetical protein
MSSPVPFDPSRKRSAAPVQMSPANRLRRLQVIAAAPDREEFLSWWAALLRRRLGSAAVIAKTFTCTEQGARYWLDGFACPTGLHLDHAMALWPDAFADRYGLVLPVVQAFPVAA